MLLGEFKDSHVWFVTNLTTQLSFRNKLKKLRLPRSKSRRRRREVSRIEKVEKNYVKAWEISAEEDDFGIVSWMKSQRTHDRKYDKAEDEVATVRHLGVSKCPSLENPDVFERDSFPDKLLKNIQCTPRYKSMKEPGLSQSAIHTTKVGFPITVESLGRVSHSRVDMLQRVCKSASPTGEPHYFTAEDKEDGMSDGAPSFPEKSYTMSDLPDSNTKVKKLMGLAQKYMDTQDRVKDEGEDCNDEGYDSKISSNEAERAEDFRHIEEVLQERERCAAETDDNQNPNSGNTFQWVRDSGGITPGRIIKLSYCQKDNTLPSVNGERLDPTGRNAPGGSIRGIMAASLSNLSPGSLNMRHFRDTGHINLLNYGVTSPHYEHNSRGYFPPDMQGDGLSARESKPAAMVLRKVTIQDESTQEKLDAEKCLPTEPNATETSDNKQTETTPVREKAMVTVTRTSPQLTVDSAKFGMNVSIPSSQQCRSRVLTIRDDIRTPKPYDPREYIYRDNSTNGRIPIGDLLPAVDKSIQKNHFQKARRTHGEMYYTGLKKDVIESQAYPSLSENERLLLIKRDMDAIAASYEVPQGPPGFKPLHTRSPLQRAKEIANKRIHGHLTQHPDGTETVRVSSPRFQPSSQRRMGSAAGNEPIEEPVTPSSRNVTGIPRFSFTKSK